ncbi:MAG: c-type cytochrome biogenesis protein CcmI [Dokdonella sp.]
MTGMFLLIAALMVATALAFVVVPLLRHRRGDRALDAASRRLHALDAALAAAVIDADEYRIKRAALDTQPRTSASTATRSSPAAFVALVSIAMLLPISALLLYRLVGAPQALDPANISGEQAAAHDARGPQLEQAIAMLVARLGEHPDDAEGWSLLGRAYSASDRVAEALDAFKHAHATAPDNAAAAVEYAQALALSAPGHRIEGESRSLLEDVLKTDPENQRALWLLGISDYQSARYDAAIARWTALLPLLAPDSSVRQSVTKQIAEAQALRDGSVTTPQDAIGVAASPKNAESAAPKLTITVSLDPKLTHRLDRDATLFVYARAAQGPPMPLAIARLKASQLPLTVTLDDSMGMLPTMKLSMFAQVVVGARISKSGNALAQSGDLQTLSAPTDVHRREPIALLIDQVVP